MKPKYTRAFSLVEVVVALGIVVFAGFALIGLLTLGIQNGQDSKQRMQAATIAEAICSVRRGAPTNDFSTSTNYPGFPLPPLQTTATLNTNNLSAPIYLTRDGMSSTVANASYGFIYNINCTNTSPGLATVYMCFFWPPKASPTNSATGRYELTTSFALP